MATLAVNVDHVATVRQARLITEPDPVTAAALAELAGCHGIIVHLREDRRHIQDRDVDILRQTVKTRLNLEMAAVPEMVGIACRIKPDMSCLVPEKRAELTTEGGLDVVGQRETMEQAVSKLKEAGIKVSLFVDADREQIQASKDVGADYVEIHTGHYCDAVTQDDQDAQFDKVAHGIMFASSLGLHVNVGHGLNYQNTQRLVPIGEIEEYSIGHSIIARAVLVGLERAVREMLEIINGRE
ncbi:MAG: pyridoxine 5'-phosphate synthase [Deltaproteobacteria bacterium]|nr:pyridoxine 5'-phosphate synthase [Deltaproteobacteria bacterium]